MAGGPECDGEHPIPHGPVDWVSPLRAAIWRAMMEIENDGADEAYKTLQHAYDMREARDEGSMLDPRREPVADDAETA